MELSLLFRVAGTLLFHRYIQTEISRLETQIRELVQKMKRLKEIFGLHFFIHILVKESASNSSLYGSTVLCYTFADFSVS